MSHYYLDAESRPNGPLSLEEIRRKAAAGEIPANPMVAAVGTSEWKPLTPTAVGAAPAAKFDRVLSDAVSALLGSARSALTPAFLENSLEFARRFGHMLVIAGGALGTAYAIYFVVKNGAWIGLLALALFLVALAAAHFVARRFLGANETLLTPSRVASPALLDGVALLALFSAVASLIGGILVCIRAELWQPLVPAVIGAALWTYVTIIALHPATVRVEHAPQTAGEETIGLVVFGMKLLLKLVPLFFFATVALGTYAILLTWFGAAEAAADLPTRNLLPLPRVLRGADGIGGMRGLSMIVTGCLIPLVAHLFFIVLSLPLDLWRAVLAVPGKLDSLRK